MYAFQKEKSFLQIQTDFQAELFRRGYVKKVYRVLKQMLFSCHKIYLKLHLEAHLLDGQEAFIPPA